MIKVVVNGARGQMGATTVGAVSAAEDMDLLASLDVGDDLSGRLAELRPDVVVDFTHPSCVKANVEAIIAAGCHAVVGTTGLSKADMAALAKQADGADVSVMIVPNFAIGAVLMMQVSTLVAKHMPRVEISEMHHDKKADAPSGTAIKTAQLIAESQPDINAEDLDETELIQGARGGACERIPIHSIRLPGYVASQSVTFGALGQTLSIRHDTISRDSFMPGVLLCVRACEQHKGTLVYGLEGLLGLA